MQVLLFFTGFMTIRYHAHGSNSKEVNSHIPQFSQQFPSHHLFSNDTGSSQLACSTYGPTQVDIKWIFKDGSIATNVFGLRQILPNGTLYFPPFAGHLFRTDVHDTTYRCRASYLQHILLSKDVRVRAIVRQVYEIKVEKTDVVLGNTAFLHCNISPYIREFVQVSAWYRDKEVLIPDPSEIGMRYIVTSPSGDLWIRNVDIDDRQKQFSCVATDMLTGEKKHSSSVFLTIKDFLPDSAPVSTQKSVTEISADLGCSIQLPCNVQGNPQPVFTWYRISDSGSLYTVPSSQRIILSQSLLFIRKTDGRDTGRWVCKAANQFGEQKLQIHLTINSELVVQIIPQIQVINAGSSATFNCTIIGSEIGKIEWFHNGRALVDGERMGDELRRITFISAVMLKIEKINKDDDGIYQCIVSNSRNSAQASAELKIGETPPEIIYSFIEQNFRTAAFVSLKCIASGSPHPQFTWMLDYQPIMSSIHRYTFDQFINENGHVTSHLNITHVKTDDGGLYTCVASNTMGTTSQKARVNVFGPPYVRAIDSIKAIAGEPKDIYCPFSGYPIQQISWLHNGFNISSRYTIADVNHGGTLHIHQVDAIQDKGTYTCIVTSPSGDEARREIQIIINTSPVIEPFSFPKNIKVGGRAQLTCSVSSGDMPVYFSWKKDGLSIPLNLQAIEKKEEFFTLLILKDISAQHSGTYTCFALNAAAQVNYTAELLVQVPPSWVREPLDLSVILGNSIYLPCEAGGFPEPTISWFRRKGKDFLSLPSKNNTLSVNYATLSDAGYYKCEAFNGVGDVLSKIVHIDVNVAVHFDSPVKNISSRRSDAVVLECVALGDDPINIIWTHKNTRIDFNNYRYSIVEMKIDNGIHSQLSILHTERYDSGKYVCSAENLYGTSEHVIYLAVQERPDPPSDLEVLKVESRRIKLSWKRPYDGMSPVLSYLVQYQRLTKAKDYSGHGFNMSWDNPFVVNVTLTKVNEARIADSTTRDEAFVNGLHPATQYLIRILAINEIESSSFTNPIVFKTQEEAPTEPPNNLKIKSGGLGQLIVTWQIPNKQSWNGELLGYTISCLEEKQNIYFVNTKNLSFTANGWATTKITISNLRKFTRYAVKIRTYNAIAASPWSPIAYGTTLEDVPEAPPQNVSCLSLSAQSIKVQWHEPAPQYHNGLLQGYKVLFRPLTKNNNFFLPYEVKRTSNLETYLHALLKATNYSIQVLSFTLSGDGTSSSPIFCVTEEDVPDPPAEIKALTLTADSILVSWLHPIHANGIITHFTVFSKENGQIGQTKSYLVRVDGKRPLHFEVRGLIENRRYDFWVTASTNKGEGDPTSVVSQTTSTRAPAKIASFSQTIKVAAGTDISLECIAVGNPTPRTRWITNDQPVTFSPYYAISQGYMKIHKAEPNLSGNYTCSAQNLFGKDEILYTLITLQTPNITLLSIQYASYDSVRIIWETSNDGGTPIQGFNLFYRPAAGTWSSISIPSDQFAYTLNGLKCGSQYVLKMNAHNKVGAGTSSDELAVWTKGKAPQIPEERDLIVTNATCLNLHLHTWHDGGCPITHFSIEYRRLHTPFWTTISSDISGTERSNDNISFCEFISATWYELKITSNNDAGETTAQFNFATTTLTGDKIPLPEYVEIKSDDTTIKMNEDVQLTKIYMIAAMITLIILAIVFLARYKKIYCFAAEIGDTNEERTNNVSQKEECSYMRSEQVYSASPVKMINKDNNAEMYEISPYATFNDSGERTVKAMCRDRTVSSLDYSLQFRTFGHLESELNAPAYPLLERSGFSHVNDDPSCHKECKAGKATDNVPGSSSSKALKYDEKAHSGSRSKTANFINLSESDSNSPINEFCRAPTFRMPHKLPRFQSNL
ncbi:cell adhesion molecule Dscam2 isoform X2 [Topomyia yanbarensis]|uniref:cell adhesion molecule Dscam2 isoform X2 n=1 Tax=Topomyia yanbarensis TaxID=2498891 RepID=UPI00273C3DB8|nr:cell adhesion molecule Dscam2 isoform X2 [Topomyia yanbarensis]